MNARITAALGLALVFWPAVAGAQMLIVGSVRDTDGYAVAGATLTAEGSGASPLPVATTSADGTFALDVPSAPSTIAVSCPYCLGVRLRFIADVPLVAVVRRFGALLADAPTAADLAASPYARPLDEMGVRPFSVVEGLRISDRGINRGNGLVFVDGAPSYRLTDGGNALRTVPGRDLQSLAFGTPFGAYQYGSGAGGGTFALDQLGDRPVLAFLAGHGDDALGAFPGVAFGAALAQSYDGGIDDRRFDARASVPFAGGRITALGGMSSNAYESDASGSLTYATVSRRYETFAAVSADRSSSVYYLSDVASDVDAAFRVRTRDPVTLEFGALAHNASGYYETGDAPSYNIGGDALEYDAYASATVSGAWGSSTAALGFSTIARSAVRSNDAGLTALTPSFRYAATLSPSWNVSVAASSSLRTPTLFEDVTLAGDGVTSVDRNSLYEIDLGYGDRHWFSADAIAFEQQTVGSAGGSIAGEGLSVRWQIAPALALRTWAMPLHSSFAPYAYGGGSGASPTYRESVWLTYAPGATRLDAIWADHRVAASVTLPVTAGLAVFAATEQPAGAPRRVSAGLRWQP